MPASLLDSLPNRLERALRETVHSGEVVHVKLKGAFKEALVCTDTRVIIVKGGFMTGQLFGTNVFQLPYANVAGVEVKFSLLSGFFELSAGGMQNTPKSYWSQSTGSDPKQAPNCVSLTDRRQAERFREACSFILAKSANARGLGGPQAPAPQVRGATARSHDEILSALDKLGKLRDSGVLSSEEFELKKKELLSRL
jgi:hypothetical protein